MNAEPFPSISAEEPAHWTIQREESRNKRCADCGKKIPAKDIFKCTPDPLDWMHLSCDTCHEDFCHECITQEDNGKSECFTCYESKLHRNLK